MTAPLISSQFPSEARVQQMPTDINPQEHWPQRTVPELIAQQAAATEGALALTAGDESLTYTQLDRRANQLARRLRSMGVGPDVPVGLCLERSLSFIVGALAILKAGGCYVPLDPDYPAGRLAFMLEDSEVSVLVTTSSLSDRLGAAGTRVPTVEINGSPVTCESPDSVPSLITSDNLAYIMYTSGSTGQPKGVQITHRALTNLVCWHQAAFKVTSADRASQLAALGFDAMVWEVWPYLTAGASVHIAGESTRKDAESLRDWLVTNHISISFVPTPLAEQMIHLQWPAYTALRFLLTGGDTLHRHPPGNLPFAVINNYGPTEATVVATSGPVLPDHNPGFAPTIGRPIANTKIYILDETMHSAPVGTIGEIHIGGIGLAKGYVNRPELTAEKFVPNPFSSELDARLYKTGDLGRYLPDGELAFCGRIDGQIKLRGHRIEPDEIVSVLNRYPAIRASTVRLCENPRGENQLVAYVVLANAARVAGHSLREFLRIELPEYMIPSVFVRLEAMPVMPNGKLDHSALHAPTAATILREESRAPRTEVERQLMRIMTSLLGIEEITPDDDFFMLGGHSLMGAQLLTKVREAFGVEITLMNLFENGTIAAMAAEIERLSMKPA
jgi:amino acid adenylation domain-containing protein